MANLIAPTPELLAEYEEWLLARPEAVRRVAEKFRPWILYRIKSSRHRVTIVSFDSHSDGSVTLKVNVTGQYNAVMFDRTVFGVDPDDLEECELPRPGEILGTVLTPEEVEMNIDAIRAMAGIPRIPGES